MSKKKKRKLNKKFIFFIIIMAAYLISLIFFTRSILSLSGVETLIRTLVLCVFYLLLIMYFIGGISCILKKRNKIFVVITIIMLLFTPIFSLGSFYIDKTFNKISKINKTSFTYTSSLIAMNDTEIKNDNDIKLGMIEDEDDIEGYVLAQKLIKEEKLNDNEIVYYEDYLEMINDLYDNQIHGAFVSENYVVMFNNEHRFENIENETKIIYSYSEEREKEEEDSDSDKKLTEPFSLLLIGVDSKSNNMNANQSFNGDTLMVITFNPNTLNATMFSIPRDTWVEIACRNNAKDKINSSAYYGTNCVIDTVENLIGFEIDYYVKINFKGVVALVDAIGGIDVEVPYSFCEQNSERKFGKDTIYVEEGLQHLDGEQALALARNRKSWPGLCAAKWNKGYRNDFVRGQNQQLVVTGIANQVKNINSVSEVYEILDAISNNIDTNLTTKQLLSFYDVAKNMLVNPSSNQSFIDIERTYLTGHDLTINNRYTFQYNESSLDEIVKAMKVNLEMEEPEMITNFNFSVNEVYEKKVVGKDSH